MARTTTKTKTTTMSLRKRATKTDSDNNDSNNDSNNKTKKKKERDVLLLSLTCLLPTMILILFKAMMMIKEDGRDDDDDEGKNNVDIGAIKIISLSILTSVIAYVITVRLVPIVAKRTHKKRMMFGLDINKRGTKMGSVEIPEACGLASGCATLVSLVLGRTLHQFIIHHHRYVSNQNNNQNTWESEHNAALAAIGFMLFLGFVDDVLDLPWRAKMVLPGFAATTLAQSYDGSTSIVVPRFLRAKVNSFLSSDFITECSKFVPKFLSNENAASSSSLLFPNKVDMKSGLMDVGYIYLLFIWLLAVFLSNAINIHAGLNGLECGQSLVIAGGIILLNVWSLLNDPTSDVVVGPHVFSLLLIAPFFAATVGLLKQNWYPSAVFVGDSYTYFAGMTLAVAGILGHFSETLLLFCLPQVLNFLYSIPQLFKFVHCPRHRLPVFDVKTGLLSPSKATETRYNMNLVTLFLRVFGKTSERKLCLRLLAFQVSCVGLTFVVRYLFIAFVHWKF